MEPTRDHLAEQVAKLQRTLAIAPNAQDKERCAMRIRMLEEQIAVEAPAVRRLTHVTTGVAEAVTPQTH